MINYILTGPWNIIKRNRRGPKGFTTTKKMIEASYNTVPERVKERKKLGKEWMSVGVYLDV